MRRAFLVCILGLGILTGGVALTVQDVTAQSGESRKAFGACDITGADAAICNERSSTVLPQRVTNGINVLLAVIGIASVITIIIGGLRYVLSMGDSAGITSAKNTILYAVIGLVVAMLAYAIVNFVVGRF